MHYVTEDELREAWTKERFDTYTVPDGAKLTPSARQFLIDFHIAFERPAPSAGAHGGGAATPDAPCGRLTSDFRAEVLVLAARARLTARRALGIDNEAAHLCDAVGRAWQDGDDAHALLGGDGESGFHPILIPALSASVHVSYYEMALLAAELMQVSGFWASAAAGCGDEEAAVSAWADSAARLASVLDGHVAAACEEVRHG